MSDVFNPLEIQRTLWELDTGQFDTRSDDEIAWEIAEAAIKRGEQPPEYMREGWQRYRASQKDGFLGSFGKGFGSQWEGSKASLKGGVALGLRALGAADEDSFLNRPYQGLLTSAQANLDKVGKDGAFIRSYADVRGLSDLVDLAGSFLGSATQSVAESVIMAGVGAAAGSAAAPGAGTAVGGIGGFLGKKGAKKYIQSQIKEHIKDEGLKKELQDYATETFAKKNLNSALDDIAGVLAKEGVEGSVKQLKEGMIKATAQQTMLNMSRGTMIGHSFVQNSGELFTDLVSRGQDTDKSAWTAVTTGSINAYLDTWLESKVLGKIFGENADTARKIARDKVRQGFENVPGGFKGIAAALSKADAGRNVGFAALAEGTTEAMQEAVNMVGIEFADPNAKFDPLQITVTLMDAFTIGGLAGGAFGGASAWSDYRDRVAFEAETLEVADMALDLQRKYVEAQAQRGTEAGLAQSFTTDVNAQGEPIVTPTPETDGDIIPAQLLLSGEVDYSLLTRGQYEKINSMLMEDLANRVEDPVTFLGRDWDKTLAEGSVAYREAKAKAAKKGESDAIEAAKAIVAARVAVTKAAAENENLTAEEASGIAEIEIGKKIIDWLTPDVVQSEEGPAMWELTPVGQAILTLRGAGVQGLEPNSLENKKDIPGGVSTLLRIADEFYNSKGETPASTIGKWYPKQAVDDEVKNIVEEVNNLERTEDGHKLADLESYVGAGDVVQRKVRERMGVRTRTDVFGKRSKVPATEIHEKASDVAGIRKVQEEFFADHDVEAYIVSEGGRAFVVVEIEGEPVTFYLSTGKGGGKWYPTPGREPQGGWANKDEDLANYYGSAKLRKVAQELDQKVGDIRKHIPKEPQVIFNDEARSFRSSTENFEDHINNDGPVPNEGGAVFPVINNMLTRIGEQPYFDISEDGKVTRRKKQVPLTAADLKHRKGEDFSSNKQWVITYPDGSTDLIFKDSDQYGSHHAPWYLVKEGELKEGEERFEYLGFKMEEAKKRLAEKRNQQEGRVPQEEQPQTDEDPRWAEAERKLREAGGLSKEEQVVPDDPRLGVTLEEIIGAPQKTLDIVEIPDDQIKNTFESLPGEVREGIRVEDGTPASILSNTSGGGRSFYLIGGSDPSKRTLVEMRGDQLVRKETLDKLDESRTEIDFFKEWLTPVMGVADFIPIGERGGFKTLQEITNAREPGSKNYLIRRKSNRTSIYFVYQGEVAGDAKTIFVPVIPVKESEERAEDRDKLTLTNTDFVIDSKDRRRRTFDTFTTVTGGQRNITEKRLFGTQLGPMVEKTGRIVLPGVNGRVVVRNLKPIGVAVGKGYPTADKPPIRYVDTNQLKDFQAFKVGGRRDTTPTRTISGREDIVGRVNPTVPAGETAYAEVADLIPDELSPAQQRFLGDALEKSGISRDEAEETETLLSPLADLMEKAATTGGANKTIINNSVAAWLRVGDPNRTSEVLGELEELLNEKTTRKKLESFFQRKQEEAEFVLEDQATEQEQAPPTQNPNIRQSAAPIETQNELHHEEVQRHVEKVSKILGTIGVEVRDDLPNTQEGYFDPDTRKIVINANLKKERATKVILHELSHRGMSYLFSRDKRAFGKFLLLKKSLEKSHTNELSALAKKYYAGKAYGKLSKWEQAVAVEEFIAKQAEGVNTPQGRALWTRIKDALIDMLKVFDPTPTWSDRDIRQFALESVGNGMRTPLQESTGDGSQVRSSSRAIWAADLLSEVDNAVNSTRREQTLPADLDDAVRQWDYQNKITKSDEWFEGGFVDSVGAFNDAALAGGDKLRAHGMTKDGTLTGATRNLLNIIRNGLDPERRSGILDTAPLAAKADNKSAGGALGTAGAEAYRNGPYILVAKEGMGLEGKLDGLGAVLVNPKHADIVAGLRLAIHETRPDVIVDSFSNAKGVTEKLSISDAAGAAGARVEPDPYAKGPEWERRDAYREVSNELLDWLGEDANTMDMGEIMDEMNAPVDPEGDPDYVPPPPRLKRLFNALAREDFLGFDRAPDLFDYLFREELPISQVSPQTKGALTSYMRTIPATRYSLADVDSEYMELAKDPEGNREVLQGLVDAAAKRAGYDTTPWFHGGRFNPDKDPIPKIKGGKKSKSDWQLDFGFHIALDPNEAKAYLPNKGGAVTRIFLTNDNILDISDSADWVVNKFFGEKLGPKVARLVEKQRKINAEFGAIADKGGEIPLYPSQLEKILSNIPPAEAVQVLQNAGYKGVRYTARANSGTGTYRPFDAVTLIDSPSQIKSADPVTYDDNGNIIPLSERFNPSSDDIRYSLAEGIPVFHGSETEGLLSFDTDPRSAYGGRRVQMGAHFGTTLDQAKHAHVTEARITLRNPLRLPDVGIWKFDTVFPLVKDNLSENNLNLFEMLDSPKNRENGVLDHALQRALVQNGYDGIVYENQHEGSGDSYIVFNPESIQNPATRYSLAEAHPAASDKEYLQMANDPNTPLREIKEVVDYKARLNGYYYGSAFHGSAEKFFKFDKEKLGETTGAPSAKKAFFFAGNKSVSEGFRDLAVSKKRDQNILAAWEKKRAQFDAAFDRIWTDDFKLKMIELVRKDKGKNTHESLIDMINEEDAKTWSPMILSYLERISDDPDIALLNKYSEEMWELSPNSYPSKEIMEKYTPEGHVGEFYLQMFNPHIEDHAGHRGNKSFSEIIETAKNNGHDGLVLRNTDELETVTDVLVVFEPSQIKSSDPITYDDKGNVIPLSERFNPSSDDIRYSLAEGTDEFSDGFEAPLDTYDMVGEIEETEKRVSAETAVLIATDLQQVLANATQSVYPEDLKRAQQFVSTKVNRATLAASETDTSVPLHERIYAERQGKITAKRVSALIALQKRFLDTLVDAKLDPTDPRAIALQEAVGRITSKVEDIQDTLRRVEYVPGPENGQGTVFQIPKAGDSDATFMSKKRTMKIGKDASTETYEGAVIRLYEYILNKESKGETDDIAYSMAVSQHNYLVDAKIGGFDDTLANSQIGGLTLGLMAEAEQLNLSGTKEGKEAAKLLNRHGSQRKLAHGQLYKLVNRAARSVVSAMDRFSMDRQQVLALLERVMHVYERDTTLAETQFSPDQLSARRARIAYNELRNDPAFTLPDTDEIRILKTIDDLARSQAEISRTLKEWNVEEGLYVEDTFRKFNPATQKWESVKGTRKHLPAGPLTFSRRMSDELRGIATSTIQEGQETNTAITNMGVLTELLETNAEDAGAAAVELITKDPNLLRLFEISRSRGSRLYKNRQGETTKPILELPTGSPEEFFDELVATHGGEVTDYVKDLVGFFRQARSAVAEIKGGMTPPSRNDTTLDTGLAVSGAMSHARSDQEWPSEAYEFNIFTDMKDLQVRTNSIAAFRSWGRDGSRLTNVLEALKIKAVKAKNEILSKLPGVRIDKHILKNPEAKAIFGDRLTTLYSEAKLEKLPDKVVRNLNTYFVRYDSGSEEMGRWRQFFNWTVNGMLQNPGTAIQSLNEIFPFFQEGVNARSMGKFGSTVKNLFLEGFAKPLAITFGMKPDKSSALREFEEATGATLDAESQRTFRDILAPVTSSYGKLPGETFEKMTELTRKAIGSHDGQAGIRPIAPFTHVVESVRKALILSNFSTITKDITQLINYYESGGLEQYPPGFADGAVRQEALNRFAEVTGMELSLYAKRAVANKAAGKPMFDRRMWVGLMDWTATQQGETHLGNLPMGLMSGAPGILSSLYKWTFVRGNELNRKRFNSKGEREQVGAWLSKYLLMVAPTLMGGIGANWLRELYMERILQKRRNKRQLEEMFTGELDDFFLGAAEQTAASGVFGYWGDILDATFNVATGDASYQGLSLDKKIIAASQVQSLFNAARFMVASGGADYSHVGRPLLNTIGMSSMIHTLHTVDRLGFELFDWEQNTARRGHVANTLSVWGRIMGYENKSFYGGAKPTPKSRALTRLEFAIYEDNIEEFKAAWKAALKSEIATGEVKSYKEAEQKLRTSLRGRHPLKKGFRTLYKQDYVNLLNEMDSGSRATTEKAVALWNKYLVAVGSSGFVGSE